MIVNPNEWQTRGKKWQDVRTAINKAKRDGITDVLTTFKEAPFSVQTQIREISAQWAGKKALPEMGFTLGGVDELIDSRVRLLYAVERQRQSPWRNQLAAHLSRRHNHRLDA